MENGDNGSKAAIELLKRIYNACFNMARLLQPSSDPSQSLASPELTTIFLFGAAGSLESGIMAFEKEVEAHAELVEYASEQAKDQDQRIYALSEENKRLREELEETRQNCELAVVRPDEILAMVDQKNRPDGKVSTEPAGREEISDDENEESEGRTGDAGSEDGHIQEKHAFEVFEHEWPPAAHLMKRMRSWDGLGLRLRRYGVQFDSSAKVYELQKPDQPGVMSWIWSAGIVDVMGNRVFESEWFGRLYFIDLEPNANWAHPCLYVLDRGEAAMTTVSGEAEEGTFDSSSFTSSSGGRA